MDEYEARYQSSKGTERWPWEKHGDCLGKSRLEREEELGRYPCSNRQLNDASSVVGDRHQGTWTRAEPEMEWSGLNYDRGTFPRDHGLVLCSGADWPPSRQPPPR